MIKMSQRKYHIWRRRRSVIFSKSFFIFLSQKKKIRCFRQNLIPVRNLLKEKIYFFFHYEYICHTIRKLPHHQETIYLTIRKISTLPIRKYLPYYQEYLPYYYENVYTLPLGKNLPYYQENICLNIRKISTLPLRKYVSYYQGNIYFYIRKKKTHRNRP